LGTPKVTRKINCIMPLEFIFFAVINCESANLGFSFHRWGDDELFITAYKLDLLE